MDEYIKREAALNALLYEMAGTGYQSRAMWAIEFIPTANVAPRAEVAREIGERIKDEIYMTLRAYCGFDAICVINMRIDGAVKKYESED